MAKARPPSDVTRFSRLVLFFWTVVVFAALAWSSWDQYNRVKDDARSVARSVFDNNIAYRRWNASMGGVYAPVSKDVVPNPYLVVPRRDVVTEDGQQLTMIDPDYMTHLAHQFMDDAGVVRGHITSLKPLRPQNAPDPWERAALLRFQQGLAEYSALEQMDGGLFMRLMRAMEVEQPCLKCHEHQGYRLGDIRGGISVSVPMADRLAGFWGHVGLTSIGSGMVWLVGFSVMVFGARAMRLAEAQRAGAEAALRASEWEFRSIVQDLPVLICRNLPDGEILFVNDAYGGYFGRSPSELIGTNIDALIPAEERATVRANLAGLGVAKPLMVHEHSVIAADGSIRFQRWTNRAIVGDDGEVLLLQAYGEDVTDRRAAEMALRESERRLSTLMQNLPGMAYRCSNVRSWTMVFVSNGCEQLTGYPAEAMIEDRDVSYGDLILVEDRELVWGQVQAAILTGRPFQLEYRVRHRDGEVRWIREQGRCVTGEGEEPVMLEGLMMDVTEARLATDKLREAAAVFACTGEGVTITDLNGAIVDVNDAFCDITGYSRDEVIGENPRLLKSGRHDRIFYQAMWKSLTASGHWRGEVWNRRKDGTIYPELLTISVVRDGSGNTTGYVGVFSDITLLKQSEEKLAHLAHHDPLTDLPNRLLFNARLHHSIYQAIRQRSILAVVFIDIDRFKHVNDSLGHPAGDQLLVELAKRLKMAVRADDTVARISGDEFVVLLEDIGSAEHAAVTVDKLMEVFKAPMIVEGESMRVTASMGISLYPQDGEEASTLLRNADAAMYRAKDEGRNTYEFYTAEMTTAAFEHVFLENAMRGALNGNEFHLVYQPQFDLATQQLIGVEALLRWQHPEQGVIMPARFIPVAEQSGLIRELGAWVLREACVQGKKWLDQGVEFGRIAVNVAGPQIQDVGFVQVVERALHGSGLPPECLEVEVTEGFVMHGAEGCIGRLELLRKMGVDIAIDDFGTGYSSLSYLKQLPVDKLKIDQSFVRDIPGDPDDMAIAEAIIAMGKALRLKVIAEGVESDAQATFLRDKGCALAQGYLFGRPVSAGEIAAMLRRH